MENRIITAVFKGSKNTKVSDVWQWDYGQTLRIQGLDLPTAVEVDFAVAGASESIARIGTTKDGVTDVVIPDSLIETGKNLVAYIYLRDSASGNTEYQIDMLVTKRAKPEAYDRPEDKKLFGQAIEAVNTAADRAEKAGQTATEAAGQAAEDAQQTAEDRKEVEKMVETVSDISEQVKKVEQLSQQAQDAADKTEADAQQTAEDRVEVGKMLETVRDVSEQVKSVEESVRKAKESEQAAAGHRTAVEEMKNSVEQTASTFPQKVQEGVQAIENAGASEVQEITQAGTSHKTAVEGAGTQAVESVENVQQVATEAVETAKTEAVQAVQAEGAKQIKEVQDKGAEVLQSIPEDFATQMETKLNKQQGIENKGKVLVIEEDGNVVPGEVASGGGDGIAIINTMSGESPLVIPDSAERVNKRLELGGKTEQAQTSGKNLANPSEFVIGTLAGDTGNIINLKQYIATGYIPVIPGKRYSTSCGNKFLVHTITAYDKEKKKINSLINMSSEMPEGAAYIRLSYKKIDMTNVTESDMEELKKVCMLNEGSKSISYEPYAGGKPSPSPEYPQEIKNAGKWNDEKQKYEIVMQVKGADTELQSLTLTSDRPLTKWDKLVEQGGQIGWLYGGKIAKDFSVKSKSTDEEVGGKIRRRFKTTLTGKFSKSNNVKCNFASTDITNSDYGIGMVGNGDVYLYFFADTKIETIEQANLLLASLPEKIIEFESESTEFVPLPQSEQNAIRALKTYYPTTVITADGGELDPDIKVTYTADTKNYIDNKVSAKVASIIRQYRLNTANLLSLMPMETQAAMIENDTNNILNNLESEETQ